MGGGGRLRAVAVHGTYEAAAVLAAAGPDGVLLISAKGAAAWPGPDGFAAIVAQAASAHPGVRHVAVLDCGAEPGSALDAIRRGWQLLVLHPCPAFSHVAAAAATLGTGLLCIRPKALDASLLDLRSRKGQAALAAWLAS